MSTSSSSTNFAQTTKGVASYAGMGFGGVMLIVVGIFQVVEGIAAIADDKIYVSGVQYTFQLDVTAWGWIHLILGIIAIAVAVGILTGQSWGLLSGVVISSLGAIACFIFLPYYPLWNIVTLAIYVFVAWALFMQMAHKNDA